MLFEFTLFSGTIYIDAPHDWVGWLGWLSILGIIVYSLILWGRQRKNWKTSHWLIFAGLLALVPLLNLFIVLRLPLGGGLTPPGKPIDPAAPALVLFSALPWVMGSLLLGAGPAAILGAISGLILAMFSTHSLFTPLEFSLYAIILSTFYHQPYRTLFFKALRIPLLAVILAAAVYPFLYLLTTVLLTLGPAAVRVDYALSHLAAAWIVFSGPLIFAGIFASILLVGLPHRWKNSGPWIPSPAECKLEARFFYNLAPLAIILVVVLVVSDWWVADRAARKMLEEQMGSTAQVTSETVPFFLEAGQNLIQQISLDSLLITGPDSEKADLLAKHLRSAPFFRQLYLFDVSGDPVAGYPTDDYTLYPPAPEEMVGIRLALNGVMIQNYPVPPMPGENAAQVTFIASVIDSSGDVGGVLVGRSDLASNPFTQPILSSINNVASIDGEGMLLDGDGRILYHSNNLRVMEIYSGILSEEARFYDDTAPDGARRLVYYQPVKGQPWSVVLSVPAQRVQQMAINIAMPLLGMVLVLFVVGILFLKVRVKGITASLNTLSFEAESISKGRLDHPLSVQGEDEIGHLGRSFEKMRASLQARMDELNRLLLVSQGVASSLEMEEAVQPVFDSALAMGACSARVFLVPAPLSGVDGGDGLPNRFGLGPSSEVYSKLDEQVLVLVRQQERVILNNLSRVRVLTMPPGYPRPEAVLAFALRHENLLYGVLWLAYDRPRQFSEDELRFFATLAGQAALAAANARLFQSADIGRQRLAAILASTPDPVLVTDHQNRLLLSNPAAWQVLGFSKEPDDGRLISQVISVNELVNLLSSSTEDRLSAEVTLPDGKIYLATASSVISEGKRVGRVCLLRDITQFKELDALKSEFVATVSHDLRSPLTMMRGYATMMEMVGDLNEQQVGYVRKILTAVENMTRLVNNLLDLGRIEAGVDLQLEMVSVQDIVERVAGSLQLQAAQKHIELEVEITEQTVPLIQADPALLQQALQNLIENGIKYTDSGGKVKVCVTTRQDGIAFEIHDTGIGIAPVDQPRLFEKFFRGIHRESKKQHGTGLGLAIVRSIAERHAGKVWVESQLGKGSTFFFVIPLRQAKRGKPNNR
jgi:PAS domain S-box-containing protein